MFKGGQPNPYDDIVAKTTDENLTSENWELILNLCDKVTDEGEQGARNVVAAVLKRLAHRNPNVQLYALALIEALSKNCGIQVHREVASRSFTQGLERLVTDRMAHDKVKRKALSLISMWATEFESDSTLGIMEECYNNLKSKGYKFEEIHEPPPPQVDDEVRRREEEELQKVLEMSMLDKGGRGQWQTYGDEGSSAAGSSRQGASSSKPAATSTTATSSTPRPRTDFGYAAASSGYVPAAVRTPSPNREAPIAAASSSTSLPSQTISTTSAYGQNGSIKAQSVTSLAPSTISRVRALHTFEGNEAGELSFEKGDIIKVVDRNYKDWWRGQLKGRTGIFPVNYVELLPDPTPDDIAKEAEQEAAIFSQAANIDKLLSMLRGLDPSKDNLADNEEIQELYRSSMSLRPKIVKLIDKYSQKRAELVTMNETFVKARTIFDRMMEESLARHSGLYDGRPMYPANVRPDSRAHQAYRVSPYPAYEQPGQFTGFPQPAPNAYGAPTPAPQNAPYAADPNAIAYANQQPAYPQGYNQTPQPSQGPAQYTQTQLQADPAAAAYANYQQPTTAQPITAQAQVQPQVQPTQVQVQPLPQPQPQPQAQIQSQQQTQQQQQQVHAQPEQNIAQDPSAAVSHQQAETRTAAQPSVMQGPPYVFDPNATYPDPGAQAWAQYYAQGGTDPAGKVYFISVPGLDNPQPAAVQSQVQQQQQQQTQPIQAQAQAQPVQQQPEVYDASHPSLNGSTPAVHTQLASGQEYGAAQQATPGSPTYARSQYFGSGAPASTSPIKEQFAPQPQPQQYSTPAYANTGTAQPQPTGQETQPPYAQQFTQMHGQFSTMGVGERSPTGAPPAAQTA